MPIRKPLFVMDLMYLIMYSMHRMYSSQFDLKTSRSHVFLNRSQISGLLISGTRD